MNEKRAIKQIEREYNEVIHTANIWLRSLDEFLNYDILAVVHGLLYAVFSMVYELAPDDLSAKEAIEGALDHIENERNKRPKIEA